MDWNTAYRIYKQIEDIQLDDPGLLELKRDLIQRALRYARIRADWPLWDIEKRRQMDSRRTTAHNAFIDACNILSRNMYQKGLDISWRNQLGQDRIEIGDFACYLHCFLGIEAR